MANADKTGFLHRVFAFRAYSGASDFAQINVRVSGYESFFRTVGEAAGARTLHGPIPNMVILDEQWTYKSDEVAHALEAGTKDR